MKMSVDSQGRVTRHFAFFNLDHSGHLNPTLPLVKEMRARGHHVSYFVPDCHGSRSKVEAAGGTWEQCGYDDFAPRHVNPGASVKRSTQPIAALLLPTFLRRMRELEREVGKIDAIVFDYFSIQGRYLGQYFQVPAICVSSIMVFPKTHCIWEEMREGWSKPTTVNHGALLSLREVYGIRNLEMDHWCEFSHPVRYTCSGISTGDENAACDRKDPLGADDQVTLGVPTFLFTSEAFQLPVGQGDMEERFAQFEMAFIGAAISQRATTPDDDALLQRLDALKTTHPEKKLIFASMGTVGFIDHEDLFEAVFEAYGPYPDKYEVVLALGKNSKDKRNSVSEFADRAPANVHLGCYLPQLELLKRADLFLTHGGMNSTTEGLYYGVPMLFRPGFWDQRPNGERVAELGAGIVLPEGQVISAKWLLEHSEKILFGDGSFKAAAQKLSESFRTDIRTDSSGVLGLSGACSRIEEIVAQHDAIVASLSDPANNDHPEAAKEAYKKERAALQKCIDRLKLRDDHRRNQK